MSGLEKIIGRITSEAQVSSGEIIDRAQAAAGEIISEGKKKTFEECERIAKKADEEAKAISERAQASAKLKQKQILLAGKQELISETVEKAFSYIKDMSDDEYIGLVNRIYRGHVPSSDCVISFNRRDLERIPQSVKKEFVRLAAEKGCVLTVSDEPCDIDNGFIIDFGGALENCSFTALIEQNMEELQDKINRKLFG